MFKYFYATQNDFDLYKKADSSEFLQSTLELIHFCLNQNNDKKDVDSPCKGPCHIHKNVYLNLHTLATCQCKPKSPTKVDFHQNYFMQIVVAQEIISEVNEKSGGKDIESVQG